MIKILNGKMEEELRTLEDNSVDSIVTDPPYGIAFMNKHWDYDVPSVEQWKEAYRVLKPGGYLLSFASTRTQHRMAVNIEDAGFEIRDMIAWIYGSGFPKSHNISKAIDKQFGTEKIVGKGKAGKTALGQSSGYNKTNNPHEFNITEPNSDEAKQWDGWGSALKPALEPITMARKPLSEKTIAQNVLKHGTGGINIDGCRVGTEERTYKGAGSSPQKLENHAEGDTGIGMLDGSGKDKIFTATGRFPANLIHDGSDEVLEVFPETVKQAKCKTDNKSGMQTSYVGGKVSTPVERKLYLDEKNTSASRFFYVAKANKKDRTEQGKVENFHPTVKPTDLMKYLVRLVTPVGGTCLDPFMGSGSTGKACILEGFDFIGIERDKESCRTARKRFHYVEVENYESNLC